MSDGNAVDYSWKPMHKRPFICFQVLLAKYFTEEVSHRLVTEVFSSVFINSVSFVLVSLLLSGVVFLAIKCMDAI